MNIGDELYQLMRKAVADELDRRVGGQPPSPEPDLERLPEAAARFGVSVSWLEARHAEGALTFYGAKRMRRVRPAEVRELLQARPKGHTSKPAQAAGSARGLSADAQRILSSVPGGRR